MAVKYENPFPDEEIADMIEQFLAIEGPDEKSFARLNKFIEFYFSPLLFGMENIPEGPTMFVGNHAMFGLVGESSCLLRGVRITEPTLDPRER